jgi:translation initiation factor IF-2
LRGGTLELIEEVVDEAVVPSGSAGRKRRRSEEIDEVAEAQALKPTRTPEDGPVVISEGMTVRAFSERLGVRARDLIQLLFNRGILATINHVLDPELAVEITRQLGFEPQVMTFEEEIRAKDQAQLNSQMQEGKSSGKVPRAPIVTIMGHVNHGKTSLLDRIRASRLVDQEYGGITQHIGAYHVQIHDRKIVFLDTPGHEAFTLMRARGARVTDVVVLVVAADDGVMPQTLEAISHARDAGVPIVVAINKIDKPNANVERVMRQLAEENLVPEEWGGDTVVVPVSAHTGAGIQQLLEMILLVADLKGLTADPDLAAQGTILEARKDTGRGVVATVLVQNGTLRIGDVFVAGSSWGRVRSMQDDLGKRLREAGPSTAVEVTGFEDLPAAGDLFQVVDSEQKARAISEFRQAEARRNEVQPVLRLPKLEDLFQQIERGEAKTLKIILKADVRGSAEVLHKEIEKLSTPKVRVVVIHSGVGAISTNDVNLARASGAIIVGFNVRPEKNAAELAEQENVDIRLHTVIYEVLSELQKAMLGQLEPVYREVLRGRAEIREIFRVRRVGTVAGCHVIEGVIPRSATARVVRDGKVVHEGPIASLKRFKDDASEVRAGFDCGLAFEQFQDLKPGDVIEAFVKEKMAPTLV